MILQPRRRTAPMARLKYVANFDQLGMGDVERFGGKNASLGEMIGRLSKAGIRVPGGFATDADAYREFIDQGGLKARIEARLNGLDADDVEALARCGAEIRGWIEATTACRSRCAPAPPPKTCPMRPSPASRRLSSTSAGFPT